MRNDVDGKTVVDVRVRHVYDACPVRHEAEFVLREVDVSPADVTSASMVIGAGRSTMALSLPISKTNVEAATVSYAVRLPLPDATVLPAAAQPEKVLA